MDNQGWNLNSLLAGLGILTFALVFVVVLYDAKIKTVAENANSVNQYEEENESGEIEEETKKEDTYTYQDMELELTKGATLYLEEEYGKHIPEGSMRITMDTLVDRNFYIHENDPIHEGEKCTGYVLVNIDGNNTDYEPYLKCGSYYETKRS